MAASKYGSETGIAVGIKICSQVNEQVSAKGYNKEQEREELLGE
jgi:hypothetical protein